MRSIFKEDGGDIALVVNKNNKAMIEVILEK